MTILPTEPSSRTPFISHVFALFVTCHILELYPSWVWPCTEVTSVLRKLRQEEDSEFEASIIHLRSSPSQMQNKTKHPNYLWTILYMLNTTADSGDTAMTRVLSRGLCVRVCVCVFGVAL